METFTLFVLIAAGCAEPSEPRTIFDPPPTCGMPRAVTGSLPKQECEKQQQEMTGAHAYCASDTRTTFTLVLTEVPDPKTGEKREMHMSKRDKQHCEDELLFFLQKYPVGGYCVPNWQSNAWWIK